MKEHNGNQQAKKPVTTINFFDFYNEAIKGRVQKKLEEEKRQTEKLPSTIPAVTIC